MPVPGTCDLTTTNLTVYRGDTWGPHAAQLCRGVTDAVLSSGSAIITSATAEFGSGDVGAVLETFTVNDDDGLWVPSGLLPDGVSVSTQDSITQVTASDVATASGTGVALLIGALDITGYTFLAEIRRNPDDTDPMGEVTVTVTDADGGNFDLSMDPAVTELLEPCLAFWDLQSTSPGGVVETWLAGRVSILADVSR